VSAGITARFDLFWGELHPLIRHSTDKTTAEIFFQRGYSTALEEVTDRLSRMGAGR
jgi:hypothetical protein